MKKPYRSPSFRFELVFEVSALACGNVIRAERPTLGGLKKVLKAIAGDSRIPPNFANRIRDMLRYGVRQIRILRYILAHTPENQTPRLLDVGAQFGALAIYATELGWLAAALDYGMYAEAFREVVADRGVEYRECDFGRDDCLSRTIRSTS